MKKEMFSVYNVLTFVQLIQTLDIQTEKNEVCNRAIKISAMVEHIDDENLVYLFSGPNVWTMKISDSKLLRVDKIGDVFPNVTGVVEAAARSAFRNMYYMHTVDYGYLIDLDKPETDNYTFNVYMNMFKEVFGLDDMPAMVVCSAVYKVATDLSETTFIAANDKSFHCHRGLCEKFMTSASKPCENTKTKPYNPNGVAAKELKDCQGLVIDDGLDPFKLSTCPKDNRRRRQTTDKERYRMLFADKESLQYWKGEDHIYKKDIRELFGCPSSFTYDLILIAVVSFVVMVILVTGIILISIMYINKRKKPGQGAEQTMTTQETRDSLKGEKTPQIEV